MKEKEWQGFAVQSVLLLAVVLALSVFHPGDIIRDNGTKVMADGTAVLNNSKKVTKQASQKKKVSGYELPVKTDKAHITARSSTYIKIPKPAVQTGAAVYLKDEYMEQCVRLVIENKSGKKLKKEDIARYNNGRKYKGKVNKKNKKDIAESMCIRYSVKKNTYRTELELKTKHLYAPVLYETDKAYFISLAKPRDVYDKIIVVDAGHGGSDEGTSSAYGHQEKDYNLLVLKELKQMLDKTDIKVYYTRLSDKKITKPARTELANKLEADLFISIHCNSEDGDGSAYGVETLYSKRKPLNSKLDNKKLSKILLNNVAEELGNKKRGVIRREGLYLMHHLEVPASIVEIGYMSNKSDLKYILKKSGQKKAARGIYKGIMEALG
ncbi:MAG: N-acetylmuramoyl-L-alanine amidase [Lachnospiraceae bacterium]|nr:N-acetylmuramoyl-L-alanine amidase [Lachnospiraceae bacterium]